ncbi:MAG: nucleoid-structuring protein H-NS [Cyclobacteriaceae bacterium]
MMNVIRNSSRVVMWVLVLMICFTGCKSKKKAAEAARAAEERARIEQEATLRKEEEEQKRKEAEEAASRDADARQQEMATNEPKARLNQYFESVARSGNVASSNSSINEALTLFSSPDTPVLIVISEEGGQKDYDRPTTIRQYLNYLKDTKNNSNSISNLQFDNSGKITEVELRKN